jgi:hypothetical protein
MLILGSSIVKDLIRHFFFPSHVQSEKDIAKKLASAGSHLEMLTVY